MKTADPSYRETSRSLPIALLRARERVMEPFREMLAKSGLSEQKWRVLRVLSERGPMEQSALAREACLMLPSLTRIAHAMERSGYLTRRSDKTDRRKSIAELTPAGQAVIDAHAEESAAIFLKLEKAFGANELERLLDLLERLNALDIRT